MSPLVWVFAVAAGVLVVGFVAAAVLTYWHARTRSERAGDLLEYVAASGPRKRAATVDETDKAHQQRAKVMHITIGDLIRDKALTEAVAKGIAERPETTTAGPSIEPTE